MDALTLPIDAVLAQFDRFDAVLDVRSEDEFAEDRLPSAQSFPVLSNDERALIGTQHKQESAFAARRAGAALVSRNIARHLEQSFADKPPGWKPLVYCWRGGQRSGAMASVLANVGWRVTRLDGGYRAYRRHVVEALAQLPARLMFRVIGGATGSGKSRLLRHLDAAGAQVLDLEGLAQHRGSVLGSLPDAPQPSQKAFESAIWWRLRGFDPARPIFVESESRKVGNLRVPDELILAMRAAPCVHLQLPVAARVRLLRDEYRHFEADPAALLRQLDCLVPLHGHAVIDRWKALVTEGAWEALVERLLHEHYDPAYQRSIDRNFRQMGQAQVLRADSSDEAEFSRLAQLLAAGS